jgi:membrane protein YdbS with pleckstrin-like domain
MLRWIWSLIPRQNIEKHLLVDEGEVVIDEVAHHWVVYTFPILEFLLGLGFLALAIFGPMDIGWLWLILMILVWQHALYRSLIHHMDRFVITNMRVFRISGVITRKIATMPIARILDITVDQSVLGRIFGYGNFVFESAAQEQGLREIHYIGDPSGRDLTIQRVIQRSGLRGPRAQMP